MRPPLGLSPGRLGRSAVVSSPEAALGPATQAPRGRPLSSRPSGRPPSVRWRGSRRRSHRHGACASPEACDDRGTAFKPSASRGALVCGHTDTKITVSASDSNQVSPRLPISPQAPGPCKWVSAQLPTHRLLFLPVRTLSGQAESEHPIAGHFLPARTAVEPGWACPPAGGVLTSYRKASTARFWPQTGSSFPRLGLPSPLRAGVLGRGWGWERPADDGPHGGRRPAKDNAGRTEHSRPARRHTAQSDGTRAGPERAQSEEPATWWRRNGDRPRG